MSGVCSGFTKWFVVLWFNVHTTNKDENLYMLIEKGTLGVQISRYTSISVLTHHPIFSNVQKKKWNKELQKYLHNSLSGHHFLAAEILLVEVLIFQSYWRKPKFLFKSLYHQSGMLPYKSKSKLNDTQF